MSAEANALQQNRIILRRALVACVVAFVFAFSLVPLYRVACEKVFGIRLEQTPTGEAKVAGYSVDTTRWVTVEFDAAVNSKLSWGFWSERSSLRVHPGELVEAMFYARNDEASIIVGLAVPSIAPAQASIYFIKTECFCFTEQLLNPGEQRPMPVRFVIDPDLPVDINTLTLSYTFYNNAHATAREAAAAAATGTPVHTSL